MGNGATMILKKFKLIPLSGDASFRKYYRKFIREKKLTTIIANGINNFVITSGTLRSKSQYRLFYTNVSQSSSVSKGIIGTLTPNGFEWSETKGIQATGFATGLDKDGVEQLYHGDNSGYIYNHDTGNVFNPAGSASNVEAQYYTPDLDFGDIGTRKTMCLCEYFTNNGVNLFLGWKNSRG